jgi:molybdopterin-containing oxidoreductase family membrane subunit
MAYAMFINLFLFGAEIFREYYSDTHHLIHYKYLFRGLHGHTSPIAIYAWTSLICSVVAFILFLIPQARKNKVTLNIGAVLIYMGVYVEKGVALVIPGFTPSMVGEIYEYAPSFQEIKVAMGVFSVGFLVFTLMIKVAVPIMLGQVSVGQKAKASK